MGEPPYCSRVVALAARPILAAGMVLTLWAGRTGRVRSLHGAEGRAPVRGYPPSISIRSYRRVPIPSRSAWSSWTDQSMSG